MSLQAIVATIIAMAPARSLYFSAVSLFRPVKLSASSIPESSRDLEDELAQEDAHKEPKPFEIRPYAFPLSNASAKRDETVPYRSTLVYSPDEAQQPSLLGDPETSEFKTVWGNLAKSVKLHGDEPFLGTRSRESDGSLGQTYEWKTYYDVFISIIHIA
jgi:hypothetical protein